MDSATNGKQIASPFSTGGGGTIFELKVQASLLALLLARAHVPSSYNDLSITELHLQAEHLGYRTDDAVVIAVDQSGNRFKQLWSMKHEVKFTPSDEVFKDVITDAWSDFNNSSIFDPKVDTIYLATTLISKKNKHLIALLEAARAASSIDDFNARLEIKGLISAESQEYLTLIRDHCSKTADREITSLELWKFVRCFYVLNYDFDQTVSQDEARIKTMLSLSMRASASNTGDELWNSIYQKVSALNPRAGSFTYDQLPADWLASSINVGVYFDSGVVHRLIEHSKPHLDRIKTSLGPHLQLERQDIVNQLSQAFLGEQCTLVTGQAGIGKSAAVRMALEKIKNGAPLLVFQATEFARDHLDQAFAEMRVTESLSKISSLFALQPTKYILIESVERLLESAQHDAFFMLLHELSIDWTWRVILTCRQYAAPMVQAAFLIPLNIRYVESNIPLLTDDELSQIILKMPALQAMKLNLRTREFLRNPWFLDKACSVDWTKESVGGSFDQPRLRNILWRQIVMHEIDQKEGIHLKRSRYFLEVALHRARTLKPFVPIAPGAEEVVQALVRDELLVRDTEGSSVAPAHDVLEDWALVRWISGEYDLHGQKPKEFFDILGNELSIRRSYRQWLQEALMKDETADIRAYIESVLGASEVEPYWKDESVVSVLMSADAARFIETHETYLLAENKKNLKVVIHLLRIACKQPNPFYNLAEVELGKKFGDIYLVPDGNAWGAIIKLIYRNLQTFDEDDLPLVLGLLEDWKAGVNPQSPVADGSREVACIALNYWNSLPDDYHWKETLTRVADILLIVPREIAKELSDYLTCSQPDMRRSYKNEIMEEKILMSVEGWLACKYLPEAVANFAERKWGIDQPLQKKPHRGREYTLDIDDYFGIQTGSMDYYPSSAFRGPFLPLLRSNFRIGTELILKLINEATTRYTESGLDERFGNGPQEVLINFGNGAIHKQWLHDRLWRMYREGVPAPHLLECALMALEKWLLELAEQEIDLQNLTRVLILRSNSVAITSVVASVAMAYPEKVGDTALALLRTPEFFEFDQYRYVSDMSPVSNIFKGMLLDPTKRFYTEERNTSDKLPHRNENFESLACRLQMTAFKESVWKIIDDYKATIPPIERQTELHRLWRLRLHRIDLRNFEVKEERDDGSILFTSKQPPVDIVEALDERASALKANNVALGAEMWGMTVFDCRETDKFDPKRWKEMLATVQELVRRKDEPGYVDKFHLESGPGYVAAVCIRDHWRDLTVEERKWCREYLIERVLEEKDSRSSLEKVQKHSRDSSRVAALVLPLLLDDADAETRQRVVAAIAAAITHAIDEVREYAADGINRYLWSRDANLASACIAGLMELALYERRSLWAYRQQGSDSRKEFRDIVAENMEQIRERIASARPLEVKSCYRISVCSRAGSEVLPLIAIILSHQLESIFAHKFFKQVVGSIVHSWEMERRRMRHFETEHALRRIYAEFVVKCAPELALELWDPFKAVIPRFPSEVADVFKVLILAEDSTHSGTSFWPLWNETQCQLLQIPSLDKYLDREHFSYAKLSATLLFDYISWKENAREWKPLQGHEIELRKYIEAIGYSPSVCKSFIRLLGSIGNMLLPEAILWLDGTLKVGNKREMIGDKESLFILTKILTPLVFGQTDVMRNPHIREATIRILDAMVDQGSSAAFRMRDFLVTPLSAKYA